MAQPYSPNYPTPYPGPMISGPIPYSFSLGDTGDTFSFTIPSAECALYDLGPSKHRSNGRAMHLAARDQIMAITARWGSLPIDELREKRSENNDTTTCARMPLGLRI